MRPLGLLGSIILGIVMLDNMLVLIIQKSIKTGISLFVD